jgi:hypothetical protein
LLDLICQFSPTIAASVCLTLAVISLVLWRGGTIKSIRIPGLFDVDLKDPIVFSGSRFLPCISGVALAGGLGLFAVQATGRCTRCDGMPGETAWIYAGQFDGRTGSFQQGPFVVSELTGTLPQNIPPGSWIKLTDSLKTMILDYSTRGVERARDSPFRLDGKVSYTCRVLPVGQRLYVADKKIDGPSPDTRHEWLRVRLTPPGVSQ